MGDYPGGKFKKLYVRYGEYRIGKLVQDFGPAYALLPGAQAADFTEGSEQGYEPSEMVGKVVDCTSTLAHLKPFRVGASIPVVMQGQDRTLRMEVRIGTTVLKVNVSR